MKKLLIRADSSSTIGTGHIMRDLVLAKQYSDSEVIFATQELEGNLNDKIKQSGYEVQILLSNDVIELIELVKELKIDEVIIDHYEINDIFEKVLKEQTDVKLMVLDDTYEKHFCDILLNHNISADEKRYRGLVPKHCELRCGSDYTLLRDEFKQEKKKKTIFLAMGGADHSHLNIKILEVLKKFNNIEVRVVTTTANQHLDELKVYVEDKQWIQLYINSDKISRLMKQSDFAIVTPSVTLNEIFYMKVPFVAIKTADNQEDMVQYLMKNHYSILESFNQEQLEKIIQRMNIELINFIDLSYSEKIEVLQWRNDASVREWMFTQELISLEKHLNYINSLALKKDRVYFLVKKDNQAIGVIDLTNIDYIKSKADIGLYANPQLKRIGDTLMKEIIYYAFEKLGIKTLVPEVFEANVSAIKLYKRFNFKETGQRENMLVMELKNEDR